MNDINQIKRVANQKEAQRKGDHSRTNRLSMNKSISTHQGQNYRLVATI